MLNSAARRKLFGDNGTLQDAMPLGDFAYTAPGSLHEQLALQETSRASSYDAFIVNWAAAEAASPGFRHAQQEMPDALLNKIQENPRQETEDFTVEEIAEMEKYLRGMHPDIFGLYDIQPAMTFRRARVSLLSFKKFDVMKPLAGNWPNLGSWATCELMSDALAMKRAISSMSNFMKLGLLPCGAPAAVIAAGKAPVLIDGYKRALFAIHRGQPMIEVMLCMTGGLHCGI